MSLKGREANPKPRSREVAFHRICPRKIAPAEVIYKAAKKSRSDVQCQGSQKATAVSGGGFAAMSGIRLSGPDYTRVSEER